MKYAYYTFILPAVLIVVFLFYTGAFDSRESSVKTIEQATQAGPVAKPWEEKTDTQPPVIIKVTPVEFGKNATLWKFQFVFDTHSGSLDDDMLSTVSLADEKGTIYKPTAWEGAVHGGHHREGILIFDPITPAPEFVELKIKDVGGIPERSFTWNMQ